MISLDTERVEAWRSARRILCVRLDTIGDVLMTTPAIRALKESGRKRDVTLLTSSAGAQVARLVPEIDDIVEYDAPWMKTTGASTVSPPDRRLLRRLHDARFDAAAIFTVYSQSSLPAALVCYLAGIPLRLAHARENPYRLLTDWVPESEPETTVRHEVRRQLDLVAAVGSTTSEERLSLTVSAGAIRRAARLVDRQGIDRNRPWLVLHPGASAPSRRYPTEAFVAAARRLSDEDGCGIVVTGAADERGLAESVRDAVGEAAVSLAGRLDLEALAGLLSLAPLLVSNNTGPVHIAAAVGTPVVDLYALTNPQHTPWGVASRLLFHDVPCKFCYSSVCREGHHNCLGLVSPDAVVEAARELLQQAERDAASGSPTDPVLLA